MAGPQLGHLAWVRGPRLGSPCDPWVNPFFIIIKWNKTKWEYFSDFLGIRYDLTENSNGWEILQRIQRLRGEIESFWISEGSFKSSEYSCDEFCKVSPNIYKRETSLNWYLSWIFDMGCLACDVC